jgi:hypothetical protein
MKTPLMLAAALVALAPLTTALAQNELPTTNVRPPKARVAVPMGAPDAHISAADAQKPFTYDPSVPYQPPTRVRPGDWNAPGMLDLSYMTEAEFRTFRGAHPTAAFFGRCYMGQDPDGLIRVEMRKMQRGINCGGGGS